MGKTSGFTLLELMIAIAILAIVTTVAIPAMQNAAEKRNTISAAEQLYSQLQLARSESVARTETLFMNISNGSDWAMGFSDDQNCDPTDNSPACTLPDLDGANAITHRVTFNDHNNVSLSSTSNQITFSPQRGTASSATITITSQGDYGYIMNVNVGVLGQISICSPNTDPTKYVSGYRVCS